MNKDTPSETALFTAFMRAYHSKYDEPKVFNDSLAERLIGPEDFARIERGLLDFDLGFFLPELLENRPEHRGLMTEVLHAMAASVILSRAQFTEQLLATAIERGVEQYVILGAGLDTYSFRCKEKLRIFELDHPATQNDKLRRAKKAALNPAVGADFVSIDFEKDDLRSTLLAAGFDAKRSAFFSWLGVSFYLERAAVFATLRALTSLAASGSMLVFDYLQDDAFVPETTSVRLQRLRARVGKLGEPMMTGFAPATLAKELHQAGFDLREQIGPDEIQARFFAGRHDGYRAFEHFRYAAAVIG